VLGGGLAAVVCLVAWLAADPGIGTAGASCAGPHLTVSPTSVAPGGSVSVVGYFFGTDCNTTISNEAAVLGEPTDDVELWVQVGDGEKLVALVDAGSDYGFQIEVPVPQSLGTGPALVWARAGRSSPAPASFVVAGDPVDGLDPPVIDADEGAIPGTDAPDLSPSGWLWFAVGAIGGGVVGVGVADRVRGRHR